MASKKNTYEGSPADLKADKAAAKKAGVSQKTYENSAADRKADARAVRKTTSTKSKGKY